MRIFRVGRRRGKASIVLGQIGGQPGVGAIDVGYACKRHGLDEPILQGLQQSLHPRLGLRGQGLDRGDPQPGGGALKRGGLGILRVVLGEDAVPVTVERRRAAVDGHIGFDRR